MSAPTTDTRIRSTTSHDRRAVDRICRATADGGDPQPADVADPELVSLVYALPYLTLEPQTSRVLEQAGTVTGYVVGALDSADFYHRWSRSWAPLHLPRADDADPALVSLLAHPMQACPPGVERFPSHLHINLLPVARSGGWGARLLLSLLESMATAGSPGVHVRVDIANEPAARFYRRLGFWVHGDGDGDGTTLTMVRELA
jgi:GNAT superfamily N-acetyltransferase